MSPLFTRASWRWRGKVKDLTAGSGYRLESEKAPDKLVDQLRVDATAFSAENGHMEFHFADREAANRAVDLLRSEKCAIEAMARTKNTLEEVYIRTIDGR